MIGVKHLAILLAVAIVSCLGATSYGGFGQQQAKDQPSPDLETKIDDFDNSPELDNEMCAVKEHALLTNVEKALDTAAGYLYEREGYGECEGQDDELIQKLIEVLERSADHISRDDQKYLDKLGEEDEDEDEEEEEEEEELQGKRRVKRQACPDGYSECRTSCGNKSCRVCCPPWSYCKTHCGWWRAKCECV